MCVSRLEGQLPLLGLKPALGGTRRGAGLAALADRRSCTDAAGGGLGGPEVTCAPGVSLSRSRKAVGLWAILE